METGDDSVIFSRNSFVFITSVLSPQALWNGVGLSAIDSSVQFYRRIAELWEVTKDTIYIYKYMNGEFQLTGTAPNPVPEYIRQQKPSRSETLQSSGIFQKIHTEYKQMGSQQTPSANRTLKSPFPLRKEKPGVDDDDDIDLGISEIPIESLEYLDIHYGGLYIMRTKVLEELNAENRFAYLRARFADGLRAISSSPAKAVLVTLYWVAALLLLLHAATPTDSVLGHLM